MTKRVGLSIFIPVLLLVSFLTFKFVNAAGITYVQGTQNKIASGTTNNLVFSKANSSGNLIVVYVIWDNGGSVSIADSKGNAYTSVAAATKWQNNTNSSQVFYAKNVAAGSNTVTATFGTSIKTFGIAYVHEYSGINTTNPLDVSTAASGTGSTMNSGSKTTTNANDLIFGPGASNNSVYQAGSGFTTRLTGWANITEDKTVNTVGSYNATATHNGTYWVMHMVAFRAASADTTPPSIPTNLGATAVSTSQINLSWTASTDNVGVVGYKVFRNGTQVGTAASPAYNDTGLATGTTYTYTVSAYDAAGNTSALSTAATGTTKTPDTIPPSAPTNLAAASTSQTQAAITWTASTDNVGVTGYSVYRSTTAGFTPSTANKIGATTTGTSYADSGLGISTYYYLVTASDAAGNVSPASNQASLVNADITAPSTPSNLTATAVSSTQVNLSWTASTDNVGVSGYKIFRNGTQLATATATTYNNTGLTASTSYSYTISAYDAAGNTSTLSSSASATTPAPPDTTPPSAPTNLTATPNSQTQVNLTWTPSTDDVGVIGYNIYRSTTTGFTPATTNKIGTTTTATNYSDSGVSIATYYYLVTAVDAANNASTPSNQATASVTDTTPPTTPANLAGTAASVSQVNLSWTAATDNVGVTSYNIYRSTTSGFTPGPTNQVGTATTTAYSDTTVTLGTYYYLVIALDAAGNTSTASNQASITVADTTPPSVPSNLTASAISTSQINLSWTASTDNVGVAGYNVFRNGVLATTTTNPSYNDTGLNPSTTYTYTVSSFDAAGNVSTLSTAASATTQTPPDTTPPSVPTNVAATAVSATQVSVSWTASTDNVGVTGYNIYRDGAQVGTTNTTSYQDQGLVANTTYSYTVAAFDAAGNLSTLSTAISASTPAPDTTPPSVPTNLTASTISSSQINLAWTASTDDVGVSGYQIFRDGTQISTSATTTYNDTGLTAGSTHNYTITAFDAAGNVSAQTSSVSATTTPPDTTPPTAPTSLSATAASQTQINLAWTASTDDVSVTGYTIYRSTTSGFAPSPTNQIGTTTTATTYNDQAAISVGTYYYVVTAVDAAGNVSLASNQATATIPDITAPSIPTNLTATAVNTSQVNLAWTASTDNVGVTGYNVYRNGLLVSTVSTASYNDVGLSPSTTYSYNVSAFDAAGNTSARTASVSATTQTPPDTTPPSTPTNLVATASSTTQINLSWTASTDNVGVTGYQIFRNGALVGTTAATTYADSGLTAGTTYTYAVAAYDAAGNISALSTNASATTAAASTILYPTTLSANHRYYLDQNGAPWFLMGETAQAMVANGNTSTYAADANTYFADRHSKGISGIWINLIADGHPASTRSDGSMLDGTLPFTTPGDLSTPNPVYWSRVDQVLTAAQNNGVIIFANPIETAGMLPTLKANGPTKDRAFGAFIGNRYKNYTNIVWLMGNDFQSWSNDPAADADLAAVSDGIKSTGDSHMQTIELNFPTSTSLDDGGTWASRIGLNMAYSYYPTYDMMQHGYAQGQMPVFFGEGNYEQTTTGGGFENPVTTNMVRRQGYWTMTSGGIGQLWGTRRIQNWDQSPLNFLNTTGTSEYLYFRDFFKTRQWYNLVPDTNSSHGFLTAGYGTYATSGNIKDSQYVTAAVTPDGSFGVAYVPAGNTTITVNMSKMSGTVTAQWFDPTTGNYSSIGLLPNTGSHQFTSPTTVHSDGTTDWVLTLQGNTPTDNIPPTTPTGVTATPVSSSQVNLSWTASTDNVGVAGYQIFRGGTLVGTSSGTTYSDAGLTGNTQYTYSIAAYDAAGNLSAPTSAVKVTTTATVGVWANIAPPQVSTDFNLVSANNYGFNSIVLDPTNPHIIFMGTNYQGLWKSTDQGATWAKINTGTGSNLLDSGRLWTLAIDPFNHNTLWTTAGYGAGGPLKSTDGGVSWTLVSVPGPPQGNDVYAIYVDPYTPNHMLVTWHSPWSTDNTNSGVSESTDGGATWINHQPPAGSNWGAGNAAWFLDNSTTWLFGSQSGGIWRTTNSGTTWTKVRATSITHGAVNSLYHDPTTNKLYLAGGNNSGGNTQVDVSANDGVTWTPTNGLPGSNFGTIVSDGTNLYTAPSFPVQSYVDGPWYYMPISGGTWQPYTSPHTCYTDPDGHSACNGPIMGAYDSVNRIGYAVNWLGGVWKIQAP